MVCFSLHLCIPSMFLAWPPHAAKTQQPERTARTRRRHIDPLCQSWPFLPAASGLGGWVAFTVVTDPVCPMEKLAGLVNPGSSQCAAVKVPRLFCQKLAGHASMRLVLQWQPLSLSSENCRLPSHGQSSWPCSYIADMKQKPYPRRLKTAP